MGKKKDENRAAAGADESKESDALQHINKKKKKQNTWYQTWYKSFAKSCTLLGAILCETGRPARNAHSFDVKKVYWDVDGNLRQGTYDRKREEELLHVLERDCGDDSDPNQVWMIIPSRWIRNWLLFSHLKLRFT